MSDHGRSTRGVDAAEIARWLDDDYVAIAGPRIAEALAIWLREHKTGAPTDHLLVLGHDVNAINEILDELTRRGVRVRYIPSAVELARGLRNLRDRHVKYLDDPVVIEAWEAERAAESAREAEEMDRIRSTDSRSARVALAVQLYDQGKSTAEIGSKLDLGESTVRRYLAEGGRSGSRESKIERAGYLSVVKGLDRAGIAEELGVCTATVTNYVASYRRSRGLEPLRKRRRSAREQFSITAANGIV